MVSQYLKSYNIYLTDPETAQVTFSTKFKPFSFKVCEPPPPLIVTVYYYYKLITVNSIAKSWNLSKRGTGINKEVPTRGEQ